MVTQRSYTPSYDCNFADFVDNKPPVTKEDSNPIEDGATMTVWTEAGGDMHSFWRRVDGNWNKVAQLM